MTRLRLLAFVLCLVVAAPLAATAGEAPAVAEAKAFLVDSCAAAKATCPQASDLLADYLSLLADALDCMGTACTVQQVNALYERDRMLDEREHRLPVAARSSGSKRPFLRLSLFVITAAGLALEKADPKATAPVYKNAEVEASKVVEEICALKEAGPCGEARSIVSKAEVLGSAATACALKTCAFPEQERLAITAEKTLGAYFGLSAKTSYDTNAIYGMLRNARIRIARLLARASASKLAELEAGERALRSGVDRLEKDAGGGNLDARIGALRAREAGVLKQYQDASITLDRTQSLLGGDPAKDRLRARINTSAAGLASARGRLIAMKTARDLGAGAPKDAGDVVRAVFADAGKATLGLVTLGARPAAAPRAVRIDRRAVPIAPPANPSAPPILKSSPGIFSLLGNARSQNPLIRADALRRLGLTNTLGDPAGRAKLVHPQNGSDTCAIVAQQQILMAHGLVPRTDPIKQEALLKREAQDRGFYLDNAGTPRAYQADLLIDRGLIVVKHVAAPIATLDAAVRRGGMIIVSVDARHLWNKRAPRPLGHAVVITGAEIARLDGETLGYYINDSGVRSNGAGRFIPIAQFKRAWNSYTKSFAEVR